MSAIPILKRILAYGGILALAIAGIGSIVGLIVQTDASGRYELMETRMGFAAVMNDLHKGRDTGRAWARLIDVSSYDAGFHDRDGAAFLFKAMASQRLNKCLSWRDSVFTGVLVLALLVRFRPKY